MEIQNILDKIIKNAKVNDFICSFSTGLSDLDQYLFSFREGNLYLIAGERNSGKSSFLTQIAVESIKLGKKVAFLTLEETQTQVIYRMLSQILSIPIFAIEKGMLNEENLRKINENKTQIENLPIDVKNSLSLEEVDTSIANYDLVIVENLSLFEKEKLDFRTNLMDIKEKAIRNGIPVIFSDLVIKPERADKRPQVEDLLHYESIEGIFDNIILLHKIPGKNNYKSDIEIIIPTAKYAETPNLFNKEFEKYFCKISERKSLTEEDLNTFEDFDFFI